MLVYFFLSLNRTPQGSVPDNVRDAGVKARGRPVQQKTDRQVAARLQGKGETVG
jgi:hypothetical protein